ncbi:proteasomal ubiquitin receptor ADRM1 [Octopus bimaculoides]|nr:proteasomal ubiquitin receptor ADRM1 [Octopus bimaculoides]|eukprot:XP_014778124.1 PREDICTED: proteasomal ubiquitin receptor ADRM1-like [Octopus bimaculoides]
MATGPLFGSSGGRSQNKNLVEFRAGRMTLKDKMVYPDKRKGLIYIYQSDDSLMHFCWKDRSLGQVEDDLIIFPDDIEFKKINQCTSGRVYVLKFKSSVRRFFFWMQEPKTEKDEEYCRKVNEYLNNPPSPTANRNNAPDHSGLVGEADLHNILGNMSQQQLMQLFGGIGMSTQNSLNLSTLLSRPVNSSSDSPRSQTSQGSRAESTSSDSVASSTRPVTATAALPSQTTETTPSSSSSGGTSTTTTTTSTTAAISSSSSSAATKTTDTPRQQIQLSDLQSILSNMHVPVDKVQDSIELSQVLKPDDIIPILANSEIQQHLLQYLPEGEMLPRTEEELRNTVQSPQFQQALQSFSAALRSRELGPLMTQFGLGDDVANAAAEGDLEAFVKALQEAQKKKEDK